jgi:hypothetical protein
MVVSGGSAGCREMFDRLGVPSPNDNPVMRVRRLFVDTYSLQHPDPFCVSATSLAAHLTGVGWILEYNGNAANGSEQIRRWLNSRPALIKPTLPATYGEVTIAAVAQTGASGDVERAVALWAQATWSAYSPLHAVAHDWIERALAYRGGAR